MENRVKIALAIHLKPFLLEPFPQVGSDFTPFSTKTAPSETSILGEALRFKAATAPPPPEPPVVPSVAKAYLSILDTLRAGRMSLVKGAGNRAYLKDSRKKASATQCGAILDAEAE